MSNVLLFDCDGVLADTERYGHLPAFNQMWEEFNVPWKWSEQQYGEKLKIGGGKERMASLFTDPEFLGVYDCPDSQEQRMDLVKQWHERKTALYKETIRGGEIPPRPGVKRLAEQVLDEGWIVGICSTSALESVLAVLRHTMGEATAEKISLVLAGDMVKAKKPSPEIYQTAAKELQVAPEQCVVIEDSRNGLLAAVGAGMKCLITVNGYTCQEDFSEAALVVSCLGDPDREQCEVISNRCNATVDRCISVANLEQVLGSE